VRDHRLEQGRPVVVLDVHADARGLGLLDDELLDVLPPGVAGVPAALPPLVGVRLPAWGKIARPK